MTQPTILEVWHGGIPSASNGGALGGLPLCVDPDCMELGGHSHTQRISDKPFSIPWRLWIKYHMLTAPDFVLHIVRPVK